jgi:ATP-dependent exoDNAse (exonuclease V) beta subunit
VAAEELLADRGAEEARLFYVACTRAVEELHLVMSGDEPDGEGPARCCAAWVSLAGQTWTAVPGTLPTPDLTLAAQQAPDLLPPLAAPPAIPRPRVIAVSDLVEIAAASTGGAGAANRAARRALGEAAHRALELHGPGMAPDQARRAVARFAGSESSAALTDLAERLAAPELIPEWATAAVRLREQPFVAELVAGDPSRLVGAKCDLLLRGRDGAWRLYDYKTGEGAAGAPTILQLQAYAAMARPHLDGPLAGAWIVDLRAGRLIEVPLPGDPFASLARAWESLLAGA